MESWLTGLIDRLDEEGTFNGWTGLNTPGELEQQSGLWLTKAGARYFTNKGFEYDPSRGPTHFEWAAVTEGEILLETEAGSQLLKEGSFYLMPGDIRLKARITGRPFLVWFEFSGQLCDAVLPMIGGDPHTLSIGKYRYAQVKTVLQLAHLMQYHPPGCSLTACSLLWRFISDAAGGVTGRKESVSPEIRRAIHYTRTLPFDKRITVAALAQQAALSTETFRKRFLAEVGESPIQHALHHRITCAKELMGDRNLTIRQIALETGFSDPYYFSRLFKQYEGVSPLSFRRRMYMDE